MPPIWLDPSHLHYSILLRAVPWPSSIRLPVSSWCVGVYDSGEDVSSRLLMVNTQIPPLPFRSGFTTWIQRPTQNAISRYPLEGACVHMATQINLVSTFSTQAQHVPAAEIQLMAGATTTGLGIV
ncbi:hypothetical protein L3X38_031885 [Prunus dulcis]|uniref:Uncharacterized protein n=1 Tax=Prunus dulcis TaxID=3755 RepID=A0AAD4VE26_PRUDU|nr:hypothetical protein L3X38_031885 [Prunus dulcis]